MGRGIQIDAAADSVNIDNNVIYSITGFSGIVIDTGATRAKVNWNYIHNNEQGVVVNEQTAQFQGNRIHNNRWGIDLNKRGATFTLLHNSNSIAGNNTNPGDSYGLSIWPGTAGAENNWWGSSSGPKATSDLSGTGNSANDTVDFNPWITGLKYSGGTVFPSSGPVVLQAKLVNSDGLPMPVPGVTVEFFADTTSTAVVTTDA